MVDLYHCFEKRKGPLLSLTALPSEEAAEIQARLIAEGKTFASRRSEAYRSRRIELERLARGRFAEKGGRPVNATPLYFVVGECPWLAKWYEESDFLKIPMREFDAETVSFTYGDLFPTFSPAAADGAEYRGEVYTVREITKIIEKYGMPQDRLGEPKFAEPRYVEARVWSDEPATRYKKAWERRRASGR